MASAFSASRSASFCVQKFRNATIVQFVLRAKNSHGMKWESGVLRIHNRQLNKRKWVFHRNHTYIEDPVQQSRQSRKLRFTGHRDGRRGSRASLIALKVVLLRRWRRRRLLLSRCCCAWSGRWHNTGLLSSIRRRYILLRYLPLLP